MSITYVDVGNDFVEQPGATLSVDPWGMDQVTRHFTGKQDMLATEVAKYKRQRNKRDATYGWLFYTSMTATESAPFAEISVTYKGTYDGKVPAPVVKSGFRKQGVTLNLAGATSDESDITATTSTITYYSPYTTYKYISKEEPKAAKYRTKIKLTAEALDIVSMSNAHLGDLNFVNGTSLSSGPNRILIYKIQPNKFNAVLELSTSQFEVQPAGRWFEVSETTELLLVPSSLARQAQRRYAVK